jgi:hypothetical protein
VNVIALFSSFIKGRLGGDASNNFGSLMRDVIWSGMRQTFEHRRCPLSLSMYIQLSKTTHGIST